MDWEKYQPFFKRSEFQCSHCGKCEMNEETMDRLFKLRLRWNRIMVPTSGYRCKDHPNEASKPRPGAHTEGRAVDIRTHGKDAYELVQVAMELGFTGIGINQKGSVGRFIHLDDMPASATRPTFWSY